MPDCVSVSFIGYELDGELANGTLTLSTAAQEFSSAVGSYHNRWSVDDAGGVSVFLPNGTEVTHGPQNSQCEGDNMLFAYGPYSRQAPSISDALQEAWDSGNWTAVHY